MSGSTANCCWGLVEAEYVVARWRLDLSAAGRLQSSSAARQAGLADAGAVRGLLRAGPSGTVPWASATVWR